MLKVMQEVLHEVIQAVLREVLGHTGGHTKGHAGGHTGHHTGGHTGGCTRGRAGGHTGSHTGHLTGGHTGHTERAVLGQGLTLRKLAEWSLQPVLPQEWKPWSYFKWCQCWHRHRGQMGLTQREKKKVAQFWWSWWCSSWMKRWDEENKCRFHQHLKWSLGWESGVLIITPHSYLTNRFCS